MRDRSRTTGVIELAGLLTVGAVACGSSGRGDDQLSGGIGPGTSVTDGATAAEGSGGPGSGGTDGGSGGGGADDGTIYDVGDGQAEAGTGDGTARCAKVDFLFVVDNSPSMRDEQQALIDSFPEFIHSIRVGAGLNDFRIMVIDPDQCNPNRGAGFLPLNCSVEQPDCYGACCATLPSATCDGMACPGCPSDTCEAGLGGGRLTDGAGAMCGVDGGRRYMLESQTNLDQTFACVANVGTEGNADERPMQSVVQSLSAPMLGSGACNDGFVRDDALLVIVVITDEDDVPETQDYGFGNPSYQFGSEGNPNTWYDAVVGAKGGQPNNVVVLSLVGPRPPDDCPPHTGYAGASVANRILEFTDKFPFHHSGPVCEQNYGPFFDTALGYIDQACDEFVPPG